MHGEFLLKTLGVRQREGPSRGTWSGLGGVNSTIIQLGFPKEGRRQGGVPKREGVPGGGRALPRSLTRRGAGEGRRAEAESGGPGGDTTTGGHTDRGSALAWVLSQDPAWLC